MPPARRALMRGADSNAHRFHVTCSDRFIAMAEPPMSAGTNKAQLLDEFNAIVTETEQLLKAVTHTGGAAGGGEAGGLDTRLDENLKAARERLALLEDTVIQRTKAAAKATDTYVRANPWQAVGIAAGIAASIGILLGLLLRRR